MKTIFYMRIALIFVSGLYSYNAYSSSAFYFVIYNQKTDSVLLLKYKDYQELDTFMSSVEETKKIAQFQTSLQKIKTNKNDEDDEVIVGGEVIQPASDFRNVMKEITDSAKYDVSSSIYYVSTVRSVSYEESGTPSEKIIDYYVITFCISNRPTALTDIVALNNNKDIEGYAWATFDQVKANAVPVTVRKKTTNYKIYKEIQSWLLKNWQKLQCPEEETNIAQSLTAAADSLNQLANALKKGGKGASFVEPSFKGSVIIPLKQLKEIIERLVTTESYLNPVTKNETIIGLVNELLNQTPNFMAKLVLLNALQKLYDETDLLKNMEMTKRLQDLSDLKNILKPYRENILNSFNNMNYADITGELTLKEISMLLAELYWSEQLPSKIISEYPVKIRASFIDQETHPKKWQIIEYVNNQVPQYKTKPESRYDELKKALEQLGITDLK